MKPDTIGCDRVRHELSARLDGEIDGETSELLDRHLETCAPCRAYEASLERVKRAVALQPAEPTRDLVPVITRRLRDEAAIRRSSRRELLRIAVAAAVITALILTGAVAPWRTGTQDIAVASEITAAVRGAARDIGSYRATFVITERGWREEVPERTFSAEISYRAPEDLRLEIDDLTDYPSEGWPTNDATLVATESSWWLRETAACPTPALPGCAVEPRREVRALVARQPFDGTTVLPTDVILPLETLVDADGLVVLGRDEVLGRMAHHVSVPLWRGRALVRSLELTGTWRSFAPNSRLHLWLDPTTWFPLRYQVRVRGVPQLDVRTTSLSEPDSFPAGTFAVPQAAQARDGGFREGPVRGPVPTETFGLQPYRSGTTTSGQSLSTYVAGMTWLRVLVDDASELSVTAFSGEAVDLKDGSSGYYRPSGPMLRRSIEIVGAGSRVRLESNLPRQELIDIAASVPVEGRAFKKLAITKKTVLRRIPRSRVYSISYAREPEWLPSGYRFSSALLSRSATERLTLFYRQAESDTGEIKITQSPGVDTLPPSSEVLVFVRAGDVEARWSEERSELDWLDNDVYRAVAVPAFDLQTAVAIATGTTSR